MIQLPHYGMGVLNIPCFNTKNQLVIHIVNFVTNMVANGFGAMAGIDDELILNQAEQWFPFRD